MSAYITDVQLYKGSDSTGTITEPAEGTIFSIFKEEFLTKGGLEEYIPTTDFSPATKKYVDEKIENELKLEFI